MKSAYRADMKTIRHAATLDYYDGPILFEGRDRIGGRYLAAAVDDVDDGELLYAVVGVSPPELERFRGGLVDLRKVMLEAGSDEWFMASYSRATEGFELKPQEMPLARSAYLPDAGYTLDPATSRDVALLDTAQRRDNLVIELRAEPPEGADGHRMHVHSLIQMLDLMQKLVGYGYRAAVRDLPRKFRPATPVEEEVLMDVVIPAAAGSFCVLLEAASQGEECRGGELSRGLEVVDALFASAKARNGVNVLTQTGGRLASTYMKMVNFVAEERVGFRYSWAGPAFSQVRRNSISVSKARRLRELMGEADNQELHEVSVMGRLVKADLKTGAWALESETEVYKGTAGADRSLLNGLVVGRDYRFSCTAKIETKRVTGKEAKTFRLESSELV